jgi:uncharacterized caspase-like protein/uncharacterized protein YraI
MAVNSVTHALARPLAAVAALVLSALAAFAEPRLALVIGNSTYANTSPLANPANDAKLMAAALEQSGFEVLSFIDLDQRGMKRAVRDFADKVAAAGPGTVALFYYAGHGLRIEGENFLVPVDADVEKESDVAIETLAVSDALSAIEQAQAAINIVVLDACRDNPLKRGFRSGSRGLARVDAPTGSIVAFSTAPGETAADGTSANSPYSAALAAALVTPGVPIEQVFKQVRIKVKAATGGKQVPWESSSLTDDFYFVKGDGGTPTPGPIATPQPQPQTGPAVDDQLAETDYLAAISEDTVEAYRGFLAKYPSSARAGQVRQVLAAKVEDNAWQRAEGAGTAGAYRQYLAAFPDGAHAAAAEAQIAALTTAPEPFTPAPTVPTDNCGPEGPYRVVGIAGNDILSIRDAPNRSGNEVGQIPPDAAGIAVGRCVAVQGYKDPWCEVSYQCQRGWSYARYLVDASGRTPGGAFASTDPAPVPRSGESYRVVDVAGNDFLNMRSGPGTNYPVVVPIPPSASGVSVQACRTVQGYRTKWCEASWQGYTGWASACCLIGERTGRRVD